MAFVAEQRGVQIERLDALSREISPLRDAVAIFRNQEVRGAQPINQFIGAVAEGLGQHRVDVAEFAILNQIDPRQRAFGDNAVAGLALRFYREQLALDNERALRNVLLLLLVWLVLFVAEPFVSRLEADQVGVPIVRPGDTFPWQIAVMFYSDRFARDRARGAGARWWWDSPPKGRSSPADRGVRTVRQ